MYKTFKPKYGENGHYVKLILPIWMFYHELLDTEFRQIKKLLRMLNYFSIVHRLADRNSQVLKIRNLATDPYCSMQNYKLI